MLVLFVYLTPIVLVILLNIRKLAQFFKKINAEMKGEGLLAKADEITTKRGLAQGDSIEELQKQKVYIIHHMWLVMEFISFVYVFPVFLFRMYLISRFGVAISWSLPVDFYELWGLIMISLSYYYSITNSPLIGMVLACIVGGAILTHTMSLVENKEGTLYIFTLPKHKIHLRDVIEEGLLVILAFGAIYYALCAANKMAFSSILSILDSIYFSLVTFATVGFGDIFPKIGVAKVLVMMEILIGLFYILVIIGIYLGVFQKHFSNTSSDHSDDNS